MNFLSDECRVSLSGKVKKQNCLMCGLERPQELFEAPHKFPSVMVLWALSRNEIIGS